MACEFAMVELNWCIAQERDRVVWYSATGQSTNNKALGFQECLENNCIVGAWSDVIVGSESTERF